MSNPIPLLLWLLLAASFGCHTTNARAHFVETAVPVGVLTYEVVAAAPFSLQVENTGDSTVEVFIRELEEGADLSYLRLSHGDRSTLSLTRATTYVVLRAKEGSSFVRISATTTSAEGEPTPDPPRLILRGRGEL
jgi:hypothetical protein